MSEKKALFEMICEIAIKDGVSQINKFDGCWERQIGEHWWIAVNGHKDSVKCSRGADVPPFNCYLEFNGWPAGVFDPFGGIICAGSEGNEEAFASAMETELAA